MAAPRVDYPCHPRGLAIPVWECRASLASDTTTTARRQLFYAVRYTHRKGKKNTVAMTLLAHVCNLCAKAGSETDSEAHDDTHKRASKSNERTSVDLRSLGGDRDLPESDGSLNERTLQR